MNFPERSGVESSDAELVTQSLAGGRNAFRQFVVRYQTLICSLAYSATGSLTRSEDLAQETFLIAWKQLGELREPDKLRSWLCGIARNLNLRAIRGQQSDPVHRAEPLDAAHESPAVEPLPRDQIISQEEEAILWRSLERIPESYREPLILFYRERQSVEQVAQVLELSEDAVRQRLSRGRKLLHDEVTAFIEGALRQTAPGPVFSGVVLAALPVNTQLVAGFGAAKGSGLVSFLTVPMLGVLASAAGTLGVIRDARTPDERQFKKRTMKAMWLDCAGLVAVLLGARYLRSHWEWPDRTFATAQLSCYLLWAVIMAPLVMVSVGRTISLRLQTRPVPVQFPRENRRLSVLAAVGAMIMGAFAPLIYRAWQAGDQLSVTMFATTAVAVMSWACCGLFFPTLFGKIRVSPSRLAWMPTILIVGVILLVLNWRLDRWIAAPRGMDLTEAHHVLPMWTIHLSTLLLVIWIIALVPFTQPKHSEPTSTLEPSS